MTGRRVYDKGGATMTTQGSETELSIAVRGGVLTLRLRIRVRPLLALLAALAALSGSPAWLPALARLLG
jgi:hypothetical protein